MKEAKRLKKIANKNNKNTYDALIDIVSYPENIKYYSCDREDYNELVLNALNNNAETIKYVSPLCKDYPYFCEYAVNQSIHSFLLIDDSVSNYKNLGIKVIIDNPYMVASLRKKSKYYYFFWKFASMICYKVLHYIDEDDKELFPLLAQVLDVEPKAILYINSNLPIYNNLCKFAYSKNPESVIFMDINRVERKLVLEIIKRNPQEIKFLDRKVSYYKEACKLAVGLDAKMFDYVDIGRCDADEDELNFAFELIDIAKKDYPDIMEHSNGIYALFQKNKLNKEKIISSCNEINDELFKQIDAIEQENEILAKQFFTVARSEIKSAKPASCLSNECPIRTNTR